jgi:hypothetical protein
MIDLTSLRFLAMMVIFPLSRVGFLTILAESGSGQAGIDAGMRAATGEFQFCE